MSGCSASRSIPSGSAAQPWADPPGLAFACGGFELAGQRPVLVRAANVLRQYDEAAVRRAWETVTGSGAVLVDGTCEPVHALLAALDDAWSTHASLRAFGPRQRWQAACAQVKAAGFAVLDRTDRVATGRADRRLVGRRAALVGGDLTSRR